MIVAVKVGTHPRTGEVLFNAWATLPGVGEVVIGSGRNEYQAQHKAARFLDSNYPNEPVTWEGGYRGGDTGGVRPSAGYWKD